MTMLSLVLDHHTNKLVLENQSLKIMKDDIVTERVPLSLLKEVIVHGNCDANTNVWRALAKEHIATVLLPGRGKGEAVFLNASLSSGYPTRQFQHRLTAQGKLHMTRYFVHQKILSLEQLIAWLSTQKMANKNDLRAVTKKLASAIAQLDNSQYPQLLGIEGSSTQAIYKVLKTCIPKKWAFKGRNKYPPKDPVNALLSLCFTLILSHVKQGVVATGFDPSLGFLHTPYPARPSLALDIIEPFRAGAMSFVLAWLIDSPYSPDDFTKASATQGVRMKKTMRGAFYSAWYQFTQNWTFFTHALEKQSNLNTLIFNQCHHTRSHLHQLYRDQPHFFYPIKDEISNKNKNKNENEKENKNESTPL